MAARKLQGAKALHHHGQLLCCATVWGTGLCAWAAPCRAHGDKEQYPPIEQWGEERVEEEEGVKARGKSAW